MKANSASVVIIGGGCSGLSAAYHLCKAGVTGVAVIEKGYLGSGATGRCGGGMRAQWSTRGNITLARHSIDHFKHFDSETGQDIDFLQGGYLLPAFSDAMLAEFRQNIALQNELGVPSRLVTVEEIHRITPLLNTDRMLGAAYCATDGKSNPFLVLKGWSERAREMGARILTYTTVTGLKRQGNRVTAVVTDQGTIDARWIIIAAGGYSNDVAGLAGLQVPVTPYRHQILVTEPIEHCFDPMIIDLQNNIYFSQAKHGAFLIGQTDRDEAPGFNQREHWRFQVEIARKMMHYMPALAHLNIVRQWAGHYDMSPDRQCILGQFSDVDNLLIAAGFSGHGFMLSPATGRALAELVTTGKCSFVDLTEYSMDRFRQSRFTVERNVV